METENNAYVYLHRRLDTNDVFYVGIGAIKNFKRAYTHHGRNNYWKKVVKKAGYVVDIVYKNISREQACKYEINLIAMYGRSDLNQGTLVNHTVGGEGAKGKILSQSTKEKLRQINLGKKHSEETKRKMSLGNKGKIRSQESRAKLSEINKNSENVKKFNRELAIKRLGLPNCLSKTYINIETGIFHYSLSEAARAYSIKLVTLQKRVDAGTGKIIPI